MTVCGTPIWTAPEILRGASYNEKADVYSYALCIWELWSFTMPFAKCGLGPVEIAIKVPKGALDLPPPFLDRPLPFLDLPLPFLDLPLPFLDLPPPFLDLPLPPAATFP